MGIFKKNNSIYLQWKEVKLTTKIRPLSTTRTRRRKKKRQRKKKKRSHSVWEASEWERTRTQMTITNQFQGETISTLAAAASVYVRIPQQRTRLAAAAQSSVEFRLLVH